MSSHRQFHCCTDRRPFYHYITLFISSAFRCRTDRGPFYHYITLFHYSAILLRWIHNVTHQLTFSRCVILRSPVSLPLKTPYQQEPLDVQEKRFASKIPGGVLSWSRDLPKCCSILGFCCLKDSEPEIHFTFHF